MKTSHWIQYLTIFTTIVLIDNVHGQSLISDMLEVGASIRDLLAQQALTTALGVVAFGWKFCNRRDAMLVGPIGALDAVFSAYFVQYSPDQKNVEHSLNGLSLVLSYATWFCPCILLTIKNAWLGFTATSLMFILQFFLWCMWKFCKTYFVFESDPNDGELYLGIPPPPIPKRVFLPPSVRMFSYNSPSENETSKPAEIQYKGSELEFTNDIELWRESYVSVDPFHYPGLIPDPSAILVLVEKLLRVSAFLIWVLAVGIATVDDFLKNMNIVSIILSAICFQANTVFFRTSSLLWSNSPTMADLDAFNELRNTTISDSHWQEEVKYGAWVDRVFLAKMLPNIFRKELKDSLFKGISGQEQWIAHVIRKACYPNLQDCLGRYDVVKSVPITHFDYIGLNVWTTLRELENHIFKECSGKTNSVPIPEPFVYNIRRRARICLLAQKHIHCPGIPELLKGFTIWANKNPIIYKTVAMVYDRYIPFGTLDPLHEGQPLSEWWFQLVQKVACPGFDIDFNLLMLIYLYEMMGNSEVSTHFKYANYLENLSVAKGSNIDFDPVANLKVIRNSIISINIPFFWADFPHEAWTYTERNRLQPSNGIITVFVHLQYMERMRKKITQTKEDYGDESTVNESSGSSSDKAD